MDTRPHTTQSSPPTIPYRVKSPVQRAGAQPLYISPIRQRVKEDVASQLSTQRAAATKPQRAEVKLVTCAQLFETGS